MHKFNQKGFAVVEAFLVFVIVAVIAAVGVYVYKTKQDSEARLEKAGQSEQQELKKAYTEKNLGNGFIEYCSSKEKACFDYPEDWQRVSHASVSDEEYFKNADNATFKSPNGSSVGWASAVDGLGGACEEGTPNVFITKISEPEGAKGLAVIRFSQEGKAAFENRIAMVNLVEDGKEIKIGDTGSCMMIPAFKSKDGIRTMQFGQGQFGDDYDIKPEDRDTIEKILLSFRY